MQLPPLSSRLRPTVIRARRGETSGVRSLDRLDEILLTVGTSPLPTSLRGADITIAFTDATRAAPDHLLVGRLLRELQSRGAERERITLIAATGLHRGMTEGEVERKLGPEIAGSIRVVNHDAFSPGALVELGEFDGMPIVVNRLCVECDLLLATGIVEPHQYAGWSGGAKTAVIGCAGERTIAATHGIATLDREGVALGRIAGNPFQRFIREAGERIGLAGVINAVVDEGGDITAAAIGPADAVHDTLIERASRDVVVPIERPADIVIAGVPEEKQVNLYQASRAATYLALRPDTPLRPGAPIIIPADIPEGEGEGTGERRFGRAMMEARSPAELVERGRREGLPAGAQRAWMVARVLVDHPIIVAGAGDRDLIERCHMHAAGSIEEALEMAERMVMSVRGAMLVRGLTPAPLDLLAVEDAIGTIVTVV